MSKYVFFRQVSIFLFILFCAMGTGAYAMDAYLEVSPSQPTYKPGDKISLTISVWNGNRKLSGSSGSSESYEWKVQTPSDRSPRQLGAFKETRPKFDYTIPNIEGEYFITCDYLFRLSGSLFSTRLSQKIPVKAQPKQTSADIGTLNGLINCQKTSGEQTQIFHTEEALTFSVVNLEQIQKAPNYSIYTQSYTRTAIKPESVKTWIWFAKAGSFDDRRSFGASIPPNSKVWLAPKEAGRYAVECAVDVFGDGRLVGTFTFNLQIVEKPITATPTPKLEILGISPIKGFFHPSFLNEIRFGYNFMVKGAPETAKVLWKASVGEMAQQPKSNTGYWSLKSDRNKCPKTVTISCETNIDGKVAKCSKAFILDSPSAPKILNITSGKVTAGESRNYYRTYSAFLSVSPVATTNNKPAVYAWSFSRNGLFTGGRSNSGTFSINDGAFSATPVLVTCVASDNGTMIGIGTLTLNLEVSKPSFGGTPAKPGTILEQGYWSCADDCPAYGSKCGEGCRGGCQPNENNPYVCKNRCSNKIRLGSSCSQCGRKSP